MNIIVYGSSNEKICPLCESKQLEEDTKRMEIFCRSCGCVCFDTTLPTMQQKIQMADFDRKFKNKFSAENEDLQNELYSFKY